MFEKDLRTQVPAYSPDKPSWGGAACCQMAMNGYPQGATPCYVNQGTIWNYIQAHNKEPGYNPSWGYGWYADPFAVTKALNDLCPPQHSWVDVSGTDKESVLYTLFRYMANYNYASLICTYAHDYWATLVYYRTSDDPRVNTNPTLDKIGYYTSEPQVQYKEVDGATWMMSPNYWGAPCNQVNSSGESLCGKIWNQKWVGIGEPPEVEGSVQVETISRVGRELISPEEAAKLAEKFLTERLREKTELSLRRLMGVQSAQPMLVRELSLEREKERQEEKTDQDVRCYVVPFVNKYEVDEAGTPLSRFSVTVNAYTGRFEELCMFSKPVRYLSEREAFWIANSNLNLSRREVRRMKVELVSSPLRPYVSTALPAWQMAIDDQILSIAQTGEVIGGYYPLYKGR